MHPIETCIRNPVKVAVGALLLILFGVIALVRMPMQLTPEVQTPTLTIETRWPGASPQEVEREIIAEQEEQLKSVEGVIKMTSESMDSSGPEQINHRERQRAITIEVSPPPEMPLEEALQRIESQIIAPIRDSGQLDGGYQIGLSGTADKLRDTWLALRWNVMLALLITYLLMAALFESWLYPLVIILSVPLGAVGGILGLRLLSVYLNWQGLPPQALDVLTMLGFVILIGTVVNNAILIVHQSLNLMREGGLHSHDAILESVRTRVRPILMTTATTVLGLCPLVLFPGSGSELYRGLGSVLLGGLLVSTLFTLVFVPTLFRIFMDVKESFGGGERPNPLDQLSGGDDDEAPSPSPHPQPQTAAHAMS
ncbi:MAG: efflux RND transporter permease subunit [Novipirellula sp. JB048]